VLVVDDDADVLEALSAALAAMGHVVESAPGGLAALAVLDRVHDIELLLTDVVMPGLHGFNLARMALMRKPDLRVLYFTGNAEIDIVQKDSGPKYGKILYKPLRPDELRRSGGGPGGTAVVTRVSAPAPRRRRARTR
jgi:two-component system, cell cycle sensor histidine kinase and response regulator CckA